MAAVARKSIGDWMTRLLQALGAPLLFTLGELKEVARVGALSFVMAFSPRHAKGAVWQQAYEIGNRSIVFIVWVAGAMGMTLVYQAGLQAERVIGDLSPMGPLYLQLLLREFGPTFSAMMVATRVGTGIAAEIGSMVVTEQVDALRMCGVHPVEYLVVPRLWASAFMVLMLSILSITVSYFAGMATANFAFGVSPYTFAQLDYVVWGDLLLMLTKSLAYGLAIPIVAAASGLAAHGGSEGVGWATTQVGGQLLICRVGAGFSYLYYGFSAFLMTLASVPSSRAELERGPW